MWYHCNSKIFLIAAEFAFKELFNYDNQLQITNYQIIQFHLIKSHPQRNLRFLGDFGGHEKRRTLGTKKDKLWGCCKRFVCIYFKKFCSCEKIERLQLIIFQMLLILSHAWRITKKYIKLLFKRQNLYSISHFQTSFTKCFKHQMRMMCAITVWKRLVDFGCELDLYTFIFPFDGALLVIKFPKTEFENMILK